MGHQLGKREVSLPSLLKAGDLPCLNPGKTQSLLTTSKVGAGGAHGNTCSPYTILKMPLEHTLCAIQSPPPRLCPATSEGSRAPQLCLSHL